MMKTARWLVVLVALPILAGCVGGDAQATADEEDRFKNPVKGKAPTPEQMKSNGPSFIGKPTSTPVGPGGPPPDGGGPPPGSVPPPPGG